MNEARVPGIKICGLTRTGDARLASELGAWALGFIFYAKSKRAVTAERVKAIVAEAGIGSAPRAPYRIGVFVNPSLDEVVHAVKHAGLTGVQLHGEESPGFCRSLRERLSAEVPALVVIKAFRTALSTEYRSVGLCDYALLDGDAGAAWGGEGVRADWALGARYATQNPEERLILAGGLRPENVAEAIREVRPVIVDVSSGVESSPGIKDAAKLNEFFKAVDDTKELTS